MSETDGPTKDPTSNKLEPRSGSADLRGIEADATLNTLNGPIPAVFQADDPTPEPKSVGAYRLIKKLGEGGMGQVWLAEQTAPVKRQVALKLIKGGLYDSAVIQRFESERQSLAVMNHPAIAKVFDAGSTKDGQPYFVMEYVEGPPITRYCDIKKLKIRERLELFIKLCEGVQHAHQRAIIHRDLKPSNVLVAEVDGKPLPRIIDFGIAKAISSQPSAEQTMFTKAGAVIGTPGFMSPEQADPSVLDVDTRTDVYSLGVLLYVLLTGTLPFDSEREKKKPIDEVLRQLREDDPPSPSAKVNTERETGTVAAERRGTDAKQLTKLLRGDLDWITMKAVEKDRARRYGMPSDLAADIERYLENRPVVARPASTAYRLEKYVRRHRIGVSAAAGLALLLAGFMVTQAIELRRIRQERDRATQERDRANRERDRATRITDFMTGMFQVSDPSLARGNKVTAREILDKASKQIDPGLSKDPELQAQMMLTMGNVYQKLGLTAPAQSLLTHSADIRSRVLGPEHPETLRTRNDLANVLFEEGRFAEAEKSYGETLEIRRRVLGPEHPDTLQSMNNVAIVLVAEGHFADAVKMLRALLEIKTRVLGTEHPDTVNTMNNLAQPLYAQGHLAEAEKLYAQTLEIRRRTLGLDAPETLAAIGNLANVLDDEGHHAEAEKMMRDSLEIKTRVLGPEHRDTLMSMHNLGDILYEEGRYDEAEKVLRQTRDISRRVLGPEYPDTAASTYSLGSIALRRGNRGEALADLREAVDHGLAPMLDLGIESDPDLKALHGDPRFDALVAHAKARAAATRKPK